ncbi:hypothetical protein SASPL_130642 [Salvia splendens]|uniref:Uncharacterized protein n=1 Tax=Salvia splendens TaxID=180675 RepID=A0A8X8X624_SALSN|nr:hypothetical protein SASPL_130642 [Salvia splendens]
MNSSSGNAPVPLPLLCLSSLVYYLSSSSAASVLYCYFRVHQDAASDTGNYLTWQNVDEATGATQGLGGRNLPRAAAMKRKSGSKHAAAAASKRTKQPRTAAIPVEDEVSSEEDDEMGDESGSDYEDDEEGGGGSAAGAFQVDDAVL